MVRSAAPGSVKLLTITRACQTEGLKYFTTRLDGASATMYGICCGISHPQLTFRMEHTARSMRQSRGCTGQQSLVWSAHRPTWKPRPRHSLCSSIMILCFVPLSMTRALETLAASIWVGELDQTRCTPSISNRYKSNAPSSRRTSGPRAEEASDRCVAAASSLPCYSSSLDLSSTTHRSRRYCLHPSRRCILTHRLRVAQRADDSIRAYERLP